MRNQLAIGGAAVALGTAVLAGNYHVVTNAQTGVRLVERAAFSFYELFVDEDMLMLLSEAQISVMYPRARVALMRDYRKQIEEGRRISASP